MDRRSPAPSCGDLRQADETKAHHAGFVIGASISAYCPDQAPPRSVNVRTPASRPRRLCTPTECSLSSTVVSTFAAAGWLETALGLSRTDSRHSQCSVSESRARFGQSRDLFLDTRLGRAGFEGLGCYRRRQRHDHRALTVFLLVGGISGRAILASTTIVMAVPRPMLRCHPISKAVVLQCNSHIWHMRKAL
jgi:hypothetical protein